MFGIYIHIPFCAHRCPFCDFTLVTNASNNLIDNYCAALCKEVQLVNQDDWPDIPLTSIYFGGGTPSHIESKNIEEIIGVIRSRFSFSPSIEITMEVNPEDVDDTKAAQWKSIGMNRISLGAQSMNDQELKRLGRHHTSQHVQDAFRTLRKNNFSNISMDLIFGLENQTVLGWETTLHQTLQLLPTHISSYNLTIEKNTAYDKEFSSKTLQLPSDDTQADMMMVAKQILEKNHYTTYEISNSAQPGFESKHNLLYWTGKPYLGLGVSAHSFFNQKGVWVRQSNTKNIPQYIRNVGEGLLPVENQEMLSTKIHLEETLMTGLRLKTGITLDELSERGIVLTSEIHKQIQSLISKGYLEKRDERIYIPPKHTSITNEILLRLFS